MSKRFKLVAYALPILIFSISISVQAENVMFRSMYVFGDSLSDIGNVYLLSQENVPPDTRYSRGRFSNGDIWIDRLAAVLRLKHTDFFPSLDSRFEVGSSGGSYAHGAAGTNLYNGTPVSPLFPVSVPVRGLLGQVEDFASDIEPKSAHPNALYALWSGANDYLLAGVPGTEIPFPPSPIMTVDRIRMAVEQLYELGAVHILVLNIPDLGNTPIAATLGLQQQLTDLTRAHNALLYEEMVSLVEDQDFKKLKLSYLDLFTLFEVIANYPAAFGFTNTFTDLGPAANCLFPISLESQSCDVLPEGFDANGSVFWDVQHPSKELHKLIAVAAAFCIKAPGTCELN